MEIRRITEATPIIIPSIVRTDLTLFRKRLLKARLEISVMAIISSPIIGDYFSVFDRNNSSGILGNVHIMRNQNNCPSLFIQILKNAQYLTPRFAVKIPRRLIGQNKAGVCNQ